MSGTRETRFSARRSHNALTKSNGLAESSNIANITPQNITMPDEVVVKSLPVDPHGQPIKAEKDEILPMEVDLTESDEKENIRKDPIEMVEAVIKTELDEQEREMNLVPNPYSQMESIHIKEEPVDPMEIEAQQNANNKQQAQNEQERTRLGLEPGAILWAAWSHNKWFPVIMTEDREGGTAKPNQIWVRYFNYNGLRSIVSTRNVFDFSLNFADELKRRGLKNNQKYTPKLLRGIHEAKVFSKFDVRIRLELFEEIVRNQKSTPEHLLEHLKAYNEEMAKYEEEFAKETQKRKEIRETLMRMKQEKVEAKATSPKTWQPTRHSLREPKRKFSIQSTESDDVDIKPDIKPPAPKKRRKSSNDEVKPLDQRFKFNKKDVPNLFKDIDDKKFCMECLEQEDLEKGVEVYKCLKCPNNYHTRCAATSKSTETVTKLVTGDGEIEVKRTIVNLTCKICASNQTAIVCFLCKMEIADEAPVTCDTSKCQHNYHEGCLKKCFQSSLNSPDVKHKCPQHECHTCLSKRTNRSGNLVKCIKCPAAYHVDRFCFPAGSQILSSTQIICPRHKTAKEAKKKKPISSTVECMVCNIGGDLLCCEQCPQVIHEDCAKNEEYNLENGKFICVDCENGVLPLYNMIIWCKVGAFRWWPAYILTPQNFIHESYRQYPREFCVKFFGTGEIAWTSCERVFEYTQNIEPLTNRPGKTMDGKFQLAIKEANEMKQILLSAGDEHTVPRKYTRIQVNRPVPPVKLKTNEYDEQEVCSCSPDDEAPCSVDSGCMARILLMECSAKKCPAGVKCQNQKLRKREYAKIEIKKTLTKGYGAFAKERIEPFTVVSEYVGELINGAELQTRKDQKAERNDKMHYFMTLEGDLYLDAERYGNTSRFINHCCDPNCDPKKVIVDGNIRVAIISNKVIEAGEELSFDYSWSCNGTDPERTKCMCGAKKCTGYLGGGLKKDEEVKKEVKDRKKAKAKRRKNNKRQSLATASMIAQEKSNASGGKKKGRRQSTAG